MGNVRTHVLSAILLVFVCVTAQPALADSLLAWGNDVVGQVTNLPSGEDFIDIAAGKEHGLGFKADHTVVAWGQNSEGQATVPAGLGTCNAIGAGWKHSLVVKSDGSLAAWGDNGRNQCDVPVGQDYEAVDGGEYYSVALRAGGFIAAWGNDSSGEVSNAPTDGGYVEIAAGMRHCLARKADGTVVAWGRTLEGQCTVPAGRYKGIAAGEDCSFGLMTDGSIVHWGQDPWSYGLDEVPAGNDFIAISSRYVHGLAIKSDGSAVGWGAGSGTEHPHYGQDSPPAGTGYTGIAAGGYWSLATTAAAASTVADHVLSIDIEQEVAYKDAADDSDIEYECWIGLTTDADVNFVEILTPAGNTFEIRDIEDNWDGDYSEQTWTSHQYDAGDGVWEWEYNRISVDPKMLDDFGDGPYTFTVYYDGGGQSQTTVWYGVPGTNDPLPQPTQRPVMVTPAPYDTTAASTNIFWEACTDANANALFVSLENTDTGEEWENEALALEDTSWSPPTLSGGFWKAGIYFDHAYFPANNDDGIPCGVMKTTCGEFWFAVGKPWAAYEVWAGETDYASPDVLLSIDQYDYVKLGDSDGQTTVFPGDHTYYVIAVRQRHVMFDAVQGSDGTYYNGGIETSNVQNADNIRGAPDGLIATAGFWETPDTFRSCLRLTNPGTWTGLSVITGTEPAPTPHDWNGDGIVSIVGDIPPFVDAVYFGNYPPWSQERRLTVGDCNDDGLVSIIGDVPCFVDCVYFQNCP